MKKIHLFFLISYLSLSTSIFSQIELVRHQFADLTYEVRRGQELSETEGKLVGKWYGTADGDEYEINRKADGTYEIIYKGNEDGEEYVDYMRGIWWIKKDKYYYHDLESSYEHMWFENYPLVEVIKESSKDRFVTTSFGAADPSTYTEKLVDEFTFELWESIDKNK